MRNPLKRLARREVDPKPTLRERAAALKVAAARVLRGRPSRVLEDADPSRRAVVAGSLAVAAAVPLPALAARSAPEAVPAGPHPDQALFDAEAEYLRTKAAQARLSKVSGEAWRAMRKALGPCPDALILQDWEDRAFNSPWRAGIVRRLPTRIVPCKDGLGNPDFAWTAEGLRQAIRLAPSAFGRAGQTPFYIRRWRGLLPLAEVHDARCNALDQGRVRQRGGVWGVD